MTPKAPINEDWRVRNFIPAVRAYRRILAARMDEFQRALDAESEFGGDEYMQWHWQNAYERLLNSTVKLEK